MKAKLFLVTFFLLGTMVAGFAQQRQQIIYSDDRSVSDFTVTDSEGVTYNLYSLLDDGKTVLLDLFTAT
jgi:cytochrome oxidase Cu insertion factor (SCO1/SenC/PrrC family)